MLSHVVCDGDHPRACGEHVVTFAPMVKSAGPSPRMRGTLNPATPEVDQTGIIPAHAGNTNWIESPTGRIRDHPRACGEHPLVCIVALPLSGSSPRMRGTPNLGNHARTNARIIPAHAGNTRNGRRAVISSRDHPRACGEHPSCGRCIVSWTGSSPRMRGTHISVDSQSKISGIIPAHAGNTGPRLASRECRRDHPRACGEHKAGRVTLSNFPGSSPRMRGTLSH